MSAAASEAPEEPSMVRVPIRAVDLPDTLWPRQEIIDGSLHATPVPTFRHQKAVHAVFHALLAVLGREFEVWQNMAMTRTEDDINRELYLVPDISVLRADARLTTNGLGCRPEDFLLVVEVLSPSTRVYDLALKLDRYRSLGIERYWVVDQETGKLTVMLGAPDETLRPLTERLYTGN